ncbi:MAG TPA: AAA family ATPase [Acidobacteriota bacterium]|nr:AAA family ATPase [Acidobacteriota bacterium]
METMQPAVLDDAALVERLKAGYRQILSELRKVIVAQDEVVEQAMISLMVGAHSMITGVPGLAKTLLIKTLARVLDLSFKRIQFTPDLMPADITGTDIIQENTSTGKRELVFVKGPIFANILLADEINRTPPKTQAALLEAMEELQVTVQGVTYVMDKPFFVLATQNPIELEGTYPLPEAQLDRFMFNIIIEYLKEDEELQVVSTTTSPQHVEITRSVSGQDILEFQKLVRRVPVPESVARYAVALVRASRPDPKGGLDFIREWVNWGASLRASQYLLLGGKARALLNGRFNVSVKDIQALAYPVMRHRILTNFHAESQKITTEEIIRRLLEAVPAPASGL